MSELNLIKDAWLPVRTVAGPRTIRLDQVVEPGVLSPAWPRADLNLACFEFLVGVFFLAMAPEDEDEWEDGRNVEASSLRKKLTHLAPAFDLLGAGPRFLQEPIKTNEQPKHPDLLFIDSSGVSTAKNNADLMVRRERYGRLSLPLAAMALYTLQSQAPAGGSGNRTSMRGGGPMMTLVKPRAESRSPLWSLIWANVPSGKPLQDLSLLPWMGPPKTSQNGEVLTPSGDGVRPEAETFFGMPRRLWLVSEGEEVTGVHQRPHGRNYEGWLHPLTPYYTADGGKLPRHPKPGAFGYRNWRGIVLEKDEGRASAVRTYLERSELTGEKRMNLLVAGWATNNMTPVDFLWSEQPLFPFSPAQNDRAAKLVEAAEAIASELVRAVRSATDEDWSTGTPERARERFFIDTQETFEAVMQRLLKEDPKAGWDWHQTLRTRAMEIFTSEVLPSLPNLQESKREKAIKARNILLAALSGRTKQGREIYELLELTPPSKRAKADKEAAK